MIDRDQPLEQQVEKQAKIIDALIQRSSRGHDVSGSAYSLFQSAIALQGEVWEKTKDLERALSTLGQASNDLEIAEFAREQSQQNLGDALDAMEGGFALFTDGKLQIFNDLFKNLIPDVAETIEPGLDFETYFEAVDRSPSVMLGRDKVARVSDEVSETPLDGSAAPFVLALKNDRWFQITHKHTSSGNIVVLQTEITAIVRKNRFEKDRLIDEQTHFLQAAFDHMSQGVCTFSVEGTLLIHNARFGNLLGLPYPLTHKGTAFGQILEFINKNRLFVEPAGEIEIGGWIDLLRGDGTLKRRISHQNGTILDIHGHRLPDGGFIVNVMDVTVESQTNAMLEKNVQERTRELTEANVKLRQQYEEQASVEEMLRVAKEEAEAAVSSKTRFLAAASHDLLQPINAAKLLISTLMEYSRETNMAETVARLDRSFSSTESLLHALLDISRLDSTGTDLSVTSFGIDEILETVREDFEPLAAKKNLRLDIVPSSAWVESDQRYLLRSVQNLVMNAIQYTETGRVLAGCRRRGDHLVVEIWDTGIGISKSDQARVFTEFTRVKSHDTGYGMGLGLSIVERACRHLNHKVSLRSKPGIGSVFSIELPLAKTGGAPHGQTPTRMARRAERVTQQADMDLIVLIVENDADVLFATVQKLESWGASVLGASSTQEALALVRDIGMPPDIILADYQLDDDDNGILTIKALRREAGEHIPAIMITANREESLTQAGREHGFTVLKKPVQLSRLRPLIDWETRQTAAQ